MSEQNNSQHNVYPGVENVRAHYRPGGVAKLLSELLEIILVPDNEDEAHSRLRSSICFISSHRILHIFYSVILMN